ncbi:hypothetical protein [Leucobacter salsicius]|nr:hypothetical protein [Leucobacter salsicius]
MAKPKVVSVDTKQLEKDLRKAGLKPDKAGLKKLAKDVEKKLSK